MSDNKPSPRKVLKIGNGAKKASPSNKSSGYRSKGKVLLLLVLIGVVLGISQYQSRYFLQPFRNTSDLNEVARTTTTTTTTATAKIITIPRPTFNFAALTKNTSFSNANNISNVDNDITTNVNANVTSTSSSRHQILSAGRKFMINCHPKLWKIFLRPELWHIFQGLIDDYGWEQLTPDEAAVLFAIDTTNSTTNSSMQEQEPPLAIMVCENNVRFSVDKYSTYEVFHKINVQQIKQTWGNATHIAIYNDDTHVFSQYSRDQMIYLLQHSDTILSTYAYLLDQFFEPLIKIPQEQKPAYIWIPHSASPPYTSLAFNPNPRRQILWSGADAPDLYPFRHYMKDEYITKLKHKGWTWKQHPGYGKHSLNQTNSYAQLLQQHFAGLSTTMIMRRIVAKTFEVPAAGALLVINDDLLPLLQALGFQDKHNFVAVPNNPPVGPTIDWVLDEKNQGMMDEIRQRGRQLILERHCTHHRSQQIDAYFTTTTTATSSTTGQANPTSRPVAFPFDVSLLKLKPNPCPMAGIRDEKVCQSRVRMLRFWFRFTPGSLKTAPLFDVTNAAEVRLRRQRRMRRL